MSLQEQFLKNPFEGYAYSYPHKLSYRPFEEPKNLQDLWNKENKDHLFLYLHIPFCEMRCGFCNLFTISNPKDQIENLYLETLQIQAQVMSDVLGNYHFDKLAVGGGTPTYLELPELEKLFHIIQNTLKVNTQKIPFSFEMSPKTVTQEKLRYLKKEGVDRASIGVQSFIENEQKKLGRPQKNKEVFEALELIKLHQFETLNLDLIYGAYGQTEESWLFSLQNALLFAPEEIFIYPLYTRPLTGIDKRNYYQEDKRFTLYLLAKDFLISNGYEQISMRMFRLKSASLTKSTSYTCQEDGMVGLGAGARSYTKYTHYSSEYAVGAKNVKAIIQNYINREPDSFSKTDYGITLNEFEIKIRYLIKSLLQSDGLNITQYEDYFKTSLIEDLPKLKELLNEGLCTINQGKWQLTSKGIDLSDAIGPWLYSNAILTKMQSFHLK
ncbi:STM4012 family radical SAM protein [Flavobacterium oreochromis]|uniref:Radical SAM core domain-containing protein n=1 Tax=Flavobacterium columnare TaxID=996 RepID=A0A2D0AHV2_9FLAO|nr:STM4012 family radical SAM protein [Flavobacterium oreochromis]OWP77687.1 hypothetical protein BWK62_06980 [Flavobacterium oreochromis]